MTYLDIMALYLMNIVSQIQLRASMTLLLNNFLPTAFSMKYSKLLFGLKRIAKAESKTHNKTKIIENILHLK